MPRFEDWDRQRDREGWDPERRIWRDPAPEAPAAAPTAPTDFGQYEEPSYQGWSSPQFNFGQVPEFEFYDFNAPSFEDAQNEPGYQFRLGSGQKALEASAAARGTLRTGGTLKDILEYGQQFGAQEYNNVYNRALRTYGENRQTAKDRFAPRFAQYQNQFGAEQARAMAEFARQMELYDAQNQNSRFKESLIYGLLNSPQPTFPTGGM